MIELEDFHEDILGKSMRGLSIGKNEMAERLSVQKSDIERILQGGSDLKLIQSMACQLNLDATKLLVAVTKQWVPAPLNINGLKQFNYPFGSMLVNAFVTWCDETKKAWIFDAGPMAVLITDFLESNNLQVDAIFLTHTHIDHIACLPDLKQKTNNSSVYVHELEFIEGCNPITEGFEHQCGSLSLQALHTHGHSVGGTTYIINGLGKQVAIVGDAVFAGSMGGGMISYEDALRTNREKIMTLSDETILCPGHGPMTTVKEEKENNPFFPEF
jgi:glyoxylase-like metal-dependent hydrolase (beta-lactamase superfamily II)